MRLPRGIALVRFALLALALTSALPALARAQDVLCDPGEREVRAVRFNGNTTFSDDELSIRVLTTPSSTTRRYLRRFGAQRCFPDIGLANDVANLRAFYRNAGFYDTRVETAVTPVSRSRVDVTFTITEGQPLVLDSLAFNGLDSLPVRAAVLRDSLLKPGERVGPQLVGAVQDSLTTRLRDAGYPRVSVFQAFDIHPAEHRAEVTFDIHPGARARFGAITIRSVPATGSEPKIDSAVVVDLLGLKPGELYSDRALADARRNLYNLGVFRQVDIAVDTTFARGD